MRDPKSFRNIRQRLAMQRALRLPDPADDGPEVRIICFFRKYPEGYPVELFEQMRSDAIYHDDCGTQRAGDDCG